MAAPFYHEESAPAALNACTALHSKLQRSQKEGILISSGGAVKFLLQTSATDYIIAKTDDNIMHFTQSSN